MRNMYLDNIYYHETVTSVVEQALHRKMKFSIKDFFSKCEQIHSFLKELQEFVLEISGD